MGNSEMERTFMSVEQKLTRKVVRKDEMLAQKFDWGSIMWMDSAELTGSETLTMGIVEFAPGQANPPHVHANCDEDLYVLEGELIHTCGPEEYHIHAGDLIHIPVGASHRATNPGKTRCRVLVAYNTGRRQVKGE
jgi:quercetin dioxygenase-like cupin family protein